MNTEAGLQLTHGRSTRANGETDDELRWVTNDDTSSNKTLHPVPSYNTRTQSRVERVWCKNDRIIMCYVLTEL